MTGSNSRENSSNDTHTTTEDRAGGGLLVQRTRDDDDDPGLNIKVSHGSNLHHVCVPSNSTFGDLKRLIAQETHMEPQMQKLLFRGNEKEDCDLLQMAGVKDNSRVVLMEDRNEKGMKSQEMDEDEANQISRGDEAVAEVRAEVDKLSEQVSALQAVVDGGNKVEENEIVYLTEMLMRQLLKLDSIEAEGEGKMQRKQEVHRVQSFVDTVDTLKARNSNPFGDCSNTVSVTTQWETFDSGDANLNASGPVLLSAKVTQEWERFD